ncbi:cytochrome P450 [Lophiostoma macrostomum CBS 122681]|uniref:Cytochrome P450 n=1 Tax=Lophiostoma macrostomum CBS 122681 TaxID=1314788 RepID=A0A6A6TN15_9PLEO|nr:cytochrome P450 [Lophiostoma macrostomum CBS 122681]
MPSPIAILTLLIPVGLGLYTYFLHPLFLSPLSRVPGPPLNSLTKWRLALSDYRGTRTRTIHSLHQLYGPLVRVGPNEVAFNSLSALKLIFGAGSGFERTAFYDMFDVYGRKNLFTFRSVREHAERKKLLASAYSKSGVLKEGQRCVRGNVRGYLELVENEGESQGKGKVVELFSSLHYFSIDSITEFLYGGFGKTACLRGRDRELLGDILDVRRRRLSWFAVHLPRVTKWMYSRTGVAEKLAEWFYPMSKPTTYTGIRVHALEAWKRFYTAQEKVNVDVEGKGDVNERGDNTIIARLWQHHEIKKAGGLSDLDIASECADHLLAGIDTTSDTLLFLIWALSRPENRMCQDKLRKEIRAVPASEFDDNGIPNLEACDKLPYLDAVIKETLRLYAPLPASEPRSIGKDITIDGYLIPTRTVVSMAPYSLHRNSEVFPDPLVFNPERWFGPEQQVSEMKKWFWAFSSGGRMCIGLHLAMAEMTALATALYRKYATELGEGFEQSAPGVTSRFEVFHDDTFENIAEHKCYVRFIPA